MTTGRPLGSQYVLGPLLGRGSMGQVFLATRRTDGALLAVKLLPDTWTDDDDAMQRLFRERRLLSTLDHPGVVKVFELVIEGRDAGIVMERVTGGDLRALMERGPMALADVVVLGRQLASALDAAHSSGVVHGDIKPENVLVDSAAPVLRVKLSDFGIARHLGPAATKSSFRGGTPRYLAPEKMTDEDVGTASDVYSLGVLLYEALTGRPPFTGRTPEAIYHAHLRIEPSRPDGMTDAWWTLLRQMLAKAPGERPSAAAVAAALVPGGPQPEPQRVTPVRSAGVSTLPPPDDSSVDPSAQVPPPINVSGASPSSPRRRAVGPAAVGTVATAVLLTVVGSVAWVNGWRPAGERPDDRIVAASPTATGASLPVAGPSSATNRASISPAPYGSPATSPSPSGSGDGGKGRRRSSTAPSSRPTTVPAPTGTGSKPRADTTKQCQAASSPGKLEIGAGLENKGGPNWVPAPCDSIWLTLTEVHYVTRAQACLESADGSATIRCGSWVFLNDNGAWNRLLDGVSPGDRWTLELKAEGPGDVAFLFSNG